MLSDQNELVTSETTHRMVWRSQAPDIVRSGSEFRRGLDALSSAAAEGSFLTRRAVVSEEFRPDELAQWLGQFAPLLRRYFRKRVSATEADELVQDVLIAMIERMDDTPLETAQRDLFAVAAQLLSKRAWALTGSRFEQIGAIVNDFSPERFAISRRKYVADVLETRKLPPRARLAFIVQRFEELTYPIVGRKLEISVSTLGKLIAQAPARVLRVLGSRLSPPIPRSSAILKSRFELAKPSSF